MREALTKSVIKAHNAGGGIWSYDWSESFSANRLADLEDSYAIFPKLFRRLVRYLKSHPSSKGFVEGLH